MQREAKIVEQCVSEMGSWNSKGMEIGNKYSKDPRVLTIFRYADKM